MPPENVPSRLPLTRISVEDPPSPRSDAVWLLNVVAPMTLPTETLPPLLFAEIRFMISIALVAPLRSISSRLMICTGRAPSPSIRLMFEPVTSTRISAASSVVSWLATIAATALATSSRLCLMLVVFMR